MSGYNTLLVEKTYSSRYFIRLSTSQAVASAAGASATGVFGVFGVFGFLGVFFGVIVFLGVFYGVFFGVFLGVYQIKLTIRSNQNSLKLIAPFDLLNNLTKVNSKLVLLFKKCSNRFSKSKIIKDLTMFFIAVKYNFLLLVE